MQLVLTYPSSRTSHRVSGDLLAVVHHLPGKDSLVDPVDKALGICPTVVPALLNVRVIRQLKI